MSIEIQLEIGHEAAIRTRKTHDGFTHDWEVFVRGCDGAEIQHYVEKIVFNLHDSFPKPKRVVKEPPYTVKESGYAGFTFPIDVYLRNNLEPKRIKFNYDLHLQNTGPAIFKVEKEKYVFTNPSEEFKYKLLKGGARKLQTGPLSSTQELLETRSTLDDKNQMTSKPKLSGADSIKKHKIKIDEPRTSTSFQDLFGLPITKTSKNLSENKSNSKDSKNSSKLDKNSSEKSNNKPSPLKDKEKSMKDGGNFDKKDKDEKKSSKDKYKERDRVKEKKGKDKSRSKSPSPKHLSPKHNSPTRLPSPQSNKQSSTSSSSYKEAKNSKDRQNKTDNKKNKKEKRDSLHKENKRNKDNDDSDKSASFQTKEVKNKIDSKNLKEYIKEDDKSPSPLIHKSPDKKDKLKEKVNVKEQPKEEDKTEKFYYDKSEEKPSKNKNKKKDKERKDKNGEKIHKTDKKMNKNSSKFSLMKEAEITNNKEINENNTKDVFNLHANETHSSSSTNNLNDEKFNDNINPLHSKFVDEDSSNSMNSNTERSPSVNRQYTDNKFDINHKKIEKEPNDLKRKEKNRNKEKKSSKDNDKKMKRKMESSSNDEKSIEKLPRTDDTHTNSSDSEPNILKEKQEVDDYISLLRDLQHKIMDLKDNAHLQKVVELIAETGRFEVSANTFDFDLCLLDRSTVQELQNFFASES